MIKSIRINLLVVACALLAAPPLISSAHAVECVNGGAGPNPAGNDHSDFTALACGNNAEATNGGTAVGTGSLATGPGYTSALGYISLANGQNGTAIGAFSTAAGANSTTTGAGSTAAGVGSTANGYGSSAVGDNSVALGIASSATGLASIATGAGSNASGAYSTAFGANTQAGGTNSIAIGGSANGGAGNAAFAGGTNAIAIGNGAQATATNSVAIGAGSVASAPNTASFGSAGNERRLTNVAAGIAPTDAVNVSQLNSLASGWTAGLQTQINTNQTEARAGVALALASGALHFDPRPGKLSVAAAVGNFRGQSALASGLGYAINSQWRVNASFSATPQVNQYGAAIGSSWTLN
jgi:autotransporter adhesin